MKILGFTQWWRPEPVPLVSSLLGSLADAGHKVEVVTGFPNYPTGALYDGYRLRLRQVEEEAGLRIIRAPLFPSHDASAARRMLTYLSFGLSSSTIGLASASRPDVAYVYHPPITAAWGARLLRRLRGVPYVLHVQDLWPDAVVSSGMLGDQTSPGFASRRLAAMISRTYRSAAHIVAISEGFQQLLVARGVPPSKVSVIPNWSPVGWPEGEGTDPLIRRSLGPSDARTLLFAGNIGPFQNLDAVVRQMAELPSSSRLHLTIMGDGIARSGLEDLVETLGTHRVTFLPSCAPALAIQYQQAADVLLVPLGSERFLQTTIPSKLATALSLGGPVLVVAEGDAARMVGVAGAGLSCAPDEPSIGRALGDLDGLDDEDLRSLGDSGRRFYRETLDLPIAVGRFEEIFGMVTR